MPGCKGHELSREYLEQVEQCVRFIAPRLAARPEWGIILGTGQAAWATRLEGGDCLEYQQLPHFPAATSPSHQGRLCWGRLAGRQVMVCQGRYHAYEGYSLRQVTLPVRVMAALGVKTLILTNAVGGLNPHFRPGELMLICDHINFMGDNPLAGANIDAWGPRFPDMSRVYDRTLRELAGKWPAARAASSGRESMWRLKDPASRPPWRPAFSG